MAELYACVFVCFFIKHAIVLHADFSDKHMRNQRPEDLDVPVALADFIHQLRTQEYTEDM